MYAAFPRSEYYQRVRLPPLHLPSSGWSIRSAYSVTYSHTKTTVDLPGSMTLPFLSVPCSQTPPESPATIARGGRLLLPSRFSTLSASGCVTRLNRFTCVTAQTSLCLRLTHVVTFMSPRLDSRWGGSFPFPGRESHPLKAPGLSWRTEEALNVGLDNMVDRPALHCQAQSPESVVAASTRTKSV